MKYEVLCELFAYLLIRNSKHTKYGTLHKGLATKYPLVNNQFPKTVRDATEIMAMHIHDDKYRSPRQGRNNNN